MSTALDPRPAPAGGAPQDPDTGATGLSGAAALRTVVGMELRQRLRSRGWYVLLGLFFLLVGVVTLGALGLRAISAGDMAGMSAAHQETVLRTAGQWMFDGVLMFTLTLALLVAPALAANAISGDRAGGTLAITQVTLLSTGQLMAGKWLAAWIASAAFVAAALPWLAVAAVVGRVSPLYVLVGILMILVEFAVVTGIGVAVSAIAGRTLFAVVVTYLLVAMLCIGSVVALVLSLQFMSVPVRASQPEYASAQETLSEEQMASMSDEDWNAYDAEQARQFPEAFDQVADACVGPVTDQEVPDGRRVAWLVAPNPFMVVADASPWIVPPATGSTTTPAPGAGPLNGLSAVYRQAQRDPRASVECLDGELRRLDPSAMPDREGTWPMWPLGLAMQGALTAGLLWWGHRRLDTPAGRLASGTRVA